MEFVKNNPNSIVSASMISLYSTTWGKEKTKELYEQFSIENKDSKFGKEITKYIESSGKPFLPFSAKEKINEEYTSFVTNKVL